MKTKATTPLSRAKAWIVLLVLWLFIPTILSANPPTAHNENPQNILFVGNSFTYYNDSIHNHVRRMLASTQDNGETMVLLRSMTISGALLSEHEGGFQNLLQSNNWDVVILQGHSLEAITDGQSENFRYTANRYMEAIRNAGATPVLFMTWAYQGAPEMTAQLARAYTAIALESGAIVAPVGLAFEKAQSNDKAITLISQDGKHPTLAGTYLAASVFYGVLFHQSPLELGYTAGLDAGTARYLRNAAWQTTQEYLAK